MLQSRNGGKYPFGLALAEAFPGAPEPGIAMHGKQVAVHSCRLDSGTASNRIVGDLYRGRVTVADPVACRRRARQCRRIAQAVGSGDVKQALLGIAKAWVKLAAQADAYEASEPQAPKRVDLQPIDFLSIFRRTHFLKNG